jgi:hypothetical protein
MGVTGEWICVSKHAITVVHEICLQKTEKSYENNSVTLRSDVQKTLILHKSASYITKGKKKLIKR